MRVEFSRGWKILSWLWIVKIPTCVHITYQKDDLGPRGPNLSDVVCWNEEEGDYYKLIMMMMMTRFFSMTCHILTMKR